MAESLDEFFSEDSLDQSQIKEEAALIHNYLTGILPLDEVIIGLIVRLQAQENIAGQGQYDISSILEDVIVGVAELLPETHDALVTLLEKLKQQEEISSFEASLLFILNERWLRYGDPDPNLSIREDVRDSWTNLNHFAALIHQSKIQDFSSLAIKTLEMTLKRGGWRVNWDGHYSKSLRTFLVANSADV